ncbi:MAG: PD40 domain-containing protein [Anaerolineaceae bacterium]|nr:PD40 domain-containing protein [Anaerolineaceae bacterium]
MKRVRLTAMLLVFGLFLIGAACNLTDLLQSGELPPTEAALLSEEASVLPTELVEPTQEPTETPAPTDLPPSQGQIVYEDQGNLWIYRVDSGEMIQVTFDGIADSYEGSYQQPSLSTDGQTLAYSKNQVSYLQELSTGTVTDLRDWGRFFKWGTAPAEFYAARGEMECPALENLEDQELLSFDVIRYNRADLKDAEILGTISGGLFFPQTISNDGRWISVLACACYSECGSHVVWDLQTNAAQGSPDFLYPGELDFSPDSQHLTVSDQQMYGYFESPLYVANHDLSGTMEIYRAPDTAVYEPKWSPDGSWIAFTLIGFDAEAYEATGSRVLLIRPDGTEALTVEEGYAMFLAWSPDGTKILYNQAGGGLDAMYVYDLASGEKTLLPIPLSSDADWGVLP